MSIKHALLGLLHDRALHGYELKSAYESHLAPQTRLNFGQVYSTLERLQRDGLVTNDRVVQAERPDRKMYSLTEAGRRELQAWLATPSTIDLDLRNHTFLKLMVARTLPHGDPLQVVQVERRACFERLHEYTQARAKARGADLQTRLLLDLAVLRLEAFLKWLEHCEAALNEEEHT